MLTLFFGPGSLSIAAHILLEEGGQEYERRLVNLGQDEQDSEAYRKINPRGRVPALQLDNGEIITENVAILPYLGKRLGFWPSDPVAEARTLSLLGYFVSSVATAAGQITHPERHTTDESAIPSVSEAGVRSFGQHLREIDAMLNGRSWFFDEYSVCDPYALTLYAYGLRRDLPVHELQHYTLFRDRMLQRPAVDRVVEREETKL